MSNAEIAPQSSPEYSFTYQAMIAGVSPSPASVPNFYPGVSQVIGCRRITASEAIGQPYLNIPAVAPNSVAKPVLISSNEDDQSVYAIYWTNRISQSQLVSVLPC